MSFNEIFAAYMENGDEEQTEHESQVEEEGSVDFAEARPLELIESDQEPEQENNNNTNEPANTQQTTENDTKTEPELNLDPLPIDNDVHSLNDTTGYFIYYLLESHNYTQSKS